MHTFECSDEFDILQQNGMFRSEKHLVAISHTAEDNDRKLKNLKSKFPDAEYVVEGDNSTTWFISQMFYPIVPGSNADFQYDDEEIQEYAAAMGVMPVTVDQSDKCPSCGGLRTEPSWGEHGYLQCDECGMVF